MAFDPESVLGRLDVLPGRFAQTQSGVPPERADTAIDMMLQQIGEALGVEPATFVLDGALTDTAARNGAGTWRRSDSRRSENCSRTPVTIGGRPFGALSVELASGGEAWPPAVDDRLRTLACVVALAIQSALQHEDLQRARDELARLTAGDTYLDVPADPTDFPDIIGDSPALLLAQQRVQEVAVTDASVVLFGETGTGKELFARAVHTHSGRRNGPFVRVNCAALPQTLIESELFGHERGAFTGAVTSRVGRFEIAHKGTIFLDEIGDLPADVQAKLLRVLQEGEFERVGSSQSRRVDVRVVAATHHDLEKAVADGRFRADLYYRLNVFPIALPPLRDRMEDLPRLVWFFINQRQRALNRRFTKVPAAVITALQQRAWPGNVRELQNVIDRAMIHSTGDTLWLDEETGPPAVRPSAQDATLEAVERHYIEDVLRRCRWRINGPGNAAEILGLHPNTLRFRMKKLGIQRPTPASSVAGFKRAAAAGFLNRS